MKNTFNVISNQVSKTILNKMSDQKFKDSLVPEKEIMKQQHYGTLESQDDGKTTLLYPRPKGNGLNQGNLVTGEVDDTKCAMVNQ